MLESMRPGSVVVDLAVDSGGNVEGSEVGKVVDVGGVKIVGHANMPARLAPATSALYARNLFNFVDLLIGQETKELAINEDDELIKGTLITRDGKVVHPALLRNQAA
jgi:NAD(P) transhydrogenase subunit alpha